MADVPRVTVRPRVMCCFPRSYWPGGHCMLDASLVRLTPGVDAPQFFCAAHAIPTDELLTDESLFRLVSVTMEIRLCGVGETPGAAHAEAVGRLERALAPIGAVINLHACRSMVVRAQPSPPVSQQKDGQGRGQ